MSSQQLPLTLFMEMNPDWKEKKNLVVGHTRALRPYVAPSRKENNNNNH